MKTDKKKCLFSINTRALQEERVLLQWRVLLSSWAPGELRAVFRVSWGTSESREYWLRHVACVHVCVKQCEGGGGREAPGRHSTKESSQWEHISQHQCHRVGFGLLFTRMSKFTLELSEFLLGSTTCLPTSTHSDCLLSGACVGGVHRTEEELLSIWTRDRKVEHLSVQVHEV